MEEIVELDGLDSPPVRKNDDIAEIQAIRVHSDSPYASSNTISSNTSVKQPTGATKGGGGGLISNFFKKRTPLNKQPINIFDDPKVSEPLIESLSPRDSPKSSGNTGLDLDREEDVEAEIKSNQKAKKLKMLKAQEAPEDIRDSNGEASNQAPEDINEDVERSGDERPHRPTNFATEKKKKSSAQKKKLDSLAKSKDPKNKDSKEPAKRKRKPKAKGGNKTNEFVDDDVEEGEEDDATPEEGFDDEMHQLQYNPPLEARRLIEEEESDMDEPSTVKYRGVVTPAGNYRYCYTGAILLTNPMPDHPKDEIKVDGDYFSTEIVNIEEELKPILIKKYQTRYPKLNVVGIELPTYNEITEYGRTTETSLVDEAKAIRKRERAKEKEEKRAKREKKETVEEREEGDEGGGKDEEKTVEEKENKKEEGEQEEKKPKKLIKKKKPLQSSVDSIGVDESSNPSNPPELKESTDPNEHKHPIEQTDHIE